MPIAISLIITNLSEQNYDGAYKSAIFFVVFSFILGLLTPLVQFIGIKGENKAYKELTGQYFTKLVSADIEYFNSNLSGYLTSATRQYADGTLGLIKSLRDRYLSTILNIVFPLIVISWFSWQLGLVTFILCIIQAVFLLWSSRKVDKYRVISREMYKQNSGKMADIISNILVIKSTAQEANSVKGVKSRASVEADVFKKRMEAQSWLIVGREAFTVAVFMILLPLTVWLMSQNTISITVAVLVITYTTTILTGLYSLSADLDGHDDFVDKIIPAFDILNRKNIIEDSPTATKIQNVKGEIEFINLSFNYDKQSENEVFSNFSLKIPAGQKLGLVGLSGSGKSTLTKLLLRFNDIDNGQILLDGIDIRDLRQIDLRRSISYVPQEPILFHYSIKDNVLVSRPDASDIEIEKALKSAHASDFIAELPNGIDSIVGERGVKLSGGQKQRIAIARAVLQHAPIFVLDEATSALDSESEQIIKNSFVDILEGKTAIVAAHRLSTLSSMDRIIVIENGQIIEDGTHHQLVELNGSYAKLWKYQQRFFG